MQRKTSKQAASSMSSGIRGIKFKAHREATAARTDKDWKHLLPVRTRQELTHDWRGWHGVATRHTVSYIVKHTLTTRLSESISGTCSGRECGHTRPAPECALLLDGSPVGTARCTRTQRMSRRSVPIAEFPPARQGSTHRCFRDRKRNAAKRETLDTGQSVAVPFTCCLKQQQLVYAEGERDAPRRGDQQVRDRETCWVVGLS